MQILLIADTHGSLNPEIRRLAERSQMIVHAGDIGQPAVLAGLTERGQTLIAVRGNNDVAGKWPAQARAQLAELPDSARVTLDGGDIVVVHGDRHNPAGRRHELLRGAYPDARLIVYGHSHRQRVDRAARPWVVNPGAAGRSRTHGGSGCVLLTIRRSGWRLRAFQFPLANWKS